MRNEGSSSQGWWRSLALACIVVMGLGTIVGSGGGDPPATPPPPPPPPPVQQIGIKGGPIMTADKQIVGIIPEGAHKMTYSVSATVKSGRLTVDRKPINGSIIDPVGPMTIFLPPGPDGTDLVLANACPATEPNASLPECWTSGIISPAFFGDTPRWGKASTLTQRTQNVAPKCQHSSRIRRTAYVLRSAKVDARAHSSAFCSRIHPWWWIWRWRWDMGRATDAGSKASLAIGRHAVCAVRISLANRCQLHYRGQRSGSSSYSNSQRYRVARSHRRAFFRGPARKDAAARHYRCDERLALVHRLQGDVIDDGWNATLRNSKDCPIR